MEINLNNIIADPFYNLLKPIFENEVDEIVCKGGRGSTKSSFIAILIVVSIMRDYHELGQLTNAVVLRKTANTLRTSVYENIVWAIDILGVSDDWHCTVSPLKAVYKLSGQEVIFKGCDESTKLKSLKFSKGYCKYIWFEEVNEFNKMKEIRSILQSLARGGKNLIFYSFNPPPSINNWANFEFSKEKSYRIIHHSSYLDINPQWLGDSFIRIAEDLKTENLKAYENEYLGKLVGLGGEIFTNIVNISLSDDEILNYDKIYHGLDFGYEDPTSFQRLHFDNRELVFLAEIYESRLHLEPLKNKINSIIDYQDLILADSASPGNISELASMGLHIKGAEKPKGSVDRGVKFLQSLKSIKIDRKRTPKTYWEFTTYEKEIDKMGNYVEKYPDKNNHTIDATRYALSKIINMQGWKFPNSRR
jgi:PBSX family phage terminase large subunit